MIADMTTLGSVITIKKGLYITKKEAKEGPYPVILGGQEPAYFIDRYNHTGKAIVISRSGASAGFVSRWNEPIFVTDGFLIEPKQGIDFDFLYYLLKYHQPQLQGLQGGAAIPHVNPRIINAIEILLPNLQKQKQIAAIITVYDELIENNKKQIKLLEEAAQRLYKEWFVDLRFPGHENTPIVDGVPEGWFWGTVDTLIEYHDKKRKPLSSLERSEFQGNYRYYGAAGVLDHVRGYLFDGIYLLLGEDGTVITSDGFPVLQYINGQFWVNNHAHVLTGKDCYSTEFIYMMFRNTKVSDVVTGVAQPKISQARLSAKKILIPETKFVLKYSEIIEPYMKGILVLQEQNEHLAESRDRLLPKLISGEIEVWYFCEDFEYQMLRVICDS